MIHISRRFLWLALGLAAAAPVSAFQVERVSVASGGAEANGESRGADVSDDGRFVAFSSRATNLSPADTDARSDIYLRDRQAGTTVLVSRPIDVLPTDGPSEVPRVSADGGIVVFQSRASNLVSSDPSNTDIFIYDRISGRVRLLSRAADGGTADASSSAPALSGDGSTVAFVSSASNLVADDTNDQPDIFVTYTLPGITRRINLGPDGREADGISADPDISGDGRFVSFTSSAPRLTGNSFGLSRVLVRDVLSGTTRVFGGNLPGHEINDIADQARISTDGRWLAFRRVRDGGVGTQTVFLANLDTGEVINVTPVDVNGVLGVGGVSAHGERVVFDSSSNGIVAGDDNGQRDVFVFNRDSGGIERLSGPGPNAGGNGESRALAITPDGRRALFASRASNLVSGDGNGDDDIFLNDTKTFTIDASITGSWYDPAQSGQGFILEYLNDGSVLFYWFTFQPGGGPDWIFGVLNVDGTVAEGEAFQKRGGLFPPEFDPGDIDTPAWGTVRFEFSGCDRGSVHWSSTRPGYGEGDFPLERLTRIPGLVCD